MTVRGAAVLILLVFVGCANGPLYTHTIRPLMTNFDRTPVSDHPPARASLKMIRWSVYVDVRWDDNAIGRIARAGGLETIYYVDVEVFRVLFLWTQTFVRVYGEPRAP